MDIAFLVAGAVGSRVLVNTLASSITSITKTEWSIAQIAIGVGIDMFLKNEMGKMIGAGAIAAGGQNLLVNLGTISGTPSDMVSYKVNGTVGGGAFDVVSGHRKPVHRLNGGQFAAVAGNGYGRVGRVQDNRPATTTGPKVIF
jgi:hypothetical protein